MNALLSRRNLIGAVVLASAAGGAVWHFRPKMAAGPVNATGGLAIQGYDPVAYFTDGRPRHGAAAHAFDWHGARWLFVSARHRDMFAADPERYAPRYGGFCAYGMAGGYKAPVDPEAFSIVEDRLYLNYSDSIRRDWMADIPGFVAKADAAWPRVAALR